MEKVVEKQLEHYLEQNQLHDKFQSAYRRYHSTESALLQVHNNIIVSLDINKATMLVPLISSSIYYNNL